MCHINPLYNLHVANKPGLSRVCPRTKVCAEDLHSKNMNAEDPNDLKGKDAEDLHAKNSNAEDPNDLEGKDGVDLHAKNLDAKPVDFIYHVTCLFTGARLDDAACKCKKLESQDYPCTHIFCILDHLGVRIHEYAKLAFPSSRTANTHVWSDHMNKYHQLCNMASDALFQSGARRSVADV